MQNSRLCKLGYPGPYGPPRSGTSPPRPRRRGSPRHSPWQKGTRNCLIFAETGYTSQDPGHNQFESRFLDGSPPVSYFSQPTVASL